MTTFARYATLLLAAVSVLIVVAASERAQAAFPGTNGKIAFTMQQGPDRHLWTMNPNGSDRTRLTNSSGRSDYGPNVSADGKRIVYATDPSQNALRIRDVNGPSDDGVGGTAGAFSPSWQPDGKGIVFAKDAGGKSDIFRLDRTTHVVTNITQTADASEESPSVSPDGTKIAFAYVAPGGSSSDIWVMDISGSARVQLTNTVDVDEGAPDWSPDGSHIVFQRWMGADKYDIFKIQSNGGNDTPVISGPNDDKDPAYSPDGTMIAWQRTLVSPAFNAGLQGAPGIKYHIFVATVTGAGITDISPLDETSDFEPNWGVDIPGPLPLLWGDNDCSHSYDAGDALYALQNQSQLGSAPSGCPGLGQTLHTAAFGDRLWGDLNCSGGFDAPDVLLLLREAAGLPPANLRDCPALGIEIALQPG